MSTPHRKPSGRWTPGKLLQAEEMFLAGSTPEEIAAALDLSRTSVRNKLTAKGMRRPRGYHLQKYHVREDAFDNPDEEAVAYWLGFLFADGNVSDTVPPRQPTVSLDLAEVDHEHVRLFAGFLGLPDAAVRHHKRKHPSVRVTIRSAPLVVSLARYGVVPRKSSAAVNAAPAGMGMNRHFMRGLIDGDGCVRIQELKRGEGRKVEHAEIILGICKGACEQFAEFCRRLCPAKVKPRQVGNHLWDYRLSGSFAWTVIRELYRDATIALPRKAAVARVIVQEFPRSGARTAILDDTPETRNPRGRTFLTARGQTLPLAEWSRITGISSVTMTSRIRYGWDDERIVNTPVLIKRERTTACSVEGCHRPHHGHGLCTMHHRQQAKAKPAEPAS